MAVVDDCSDLRLACDFAYYSPLPQVLALGWVGARTVPRIGWEWALLGLNPHLTPARALGHRPTLLVAMGGSDPLGLTMRAARILAPLDSNFRIRFVIGSGMQDARVVAAGIAAMKNNYETVEGADACPRNMPPPIWRFAPSVSPPMSWPLSACRPSIWVLPTIRPLGFRLLQGRHGGVAGRRGTGERRGNMGAVRALMNSPGRRREMRAMGLATMDGAGAARIAADLAQALREENQPVKAAR